MKIISKLAESWVAARKEPLPAWGLAAELRGFPKNMIGPLTKRMQDAGVIDVVT